MKPLHFLALLPLALVAATASAETENRQANPSDFNFSTVVSRTVEKDLMQANLYSTKTGKSLPELKKAVSQNLNRVLETAKKYPSIEIEAEGIGNNANYSKNGNITGWQASGSINLKSKDFEAMAAVLDSLDKEVAINYIGFSVSPEKMAELEDEMTLEIIAKFKHKADIIQKALGAKSYKLSNININTPNGRDNYYDHRVMYDNVKAIAASPAMEEMPLEAGKTTISASASGRVEFE